MGASVYVVVQYLSLLFVLILIFFLYLIFDESFSKYKFLGKWWFISLVGIIGGVLGSTIFGSAFNKNPFKRFKIGKLWKADIK
ncbi:MAG: hypothetical protein HC803_11410 [Saprospiraceae bacterium]|nr:hypothetical protein [Saprospiraceae bacterium]